MSCGAVELLTSATGLDRSYFDAERRGTDQLPFSETAGSSSRAKSLANGPLNDFF